MKLQEQGKLFIQNREVFTFDELKKELGVEHNFYLAISVINDLKRKNLIEKITDGVWRKKNIKE